MDKVRKLLSQIRQYNKAYRSGEAVISDQEYDKLVSELARIDPENDWFKRIEPAEIKQKRKSKLPVPMKSLSKVKDIKSLISWAKSIGMSMNDQVVITPKFDGLSLLHDERNNKAWSRGGAENEGQDCTPHYNAATRIKNADTVLPYTYGEFVFSHESWIANFAGKMSPDTGDRYKSPRNTAAGLLNRDEPSENLKYVDFFRYGTDENSLSNFSTYKELYEYLCTEFEQPKLYEALTVQDITKELCLELFQKWVHEYYIDGLVIYVNSLDVWSKVGRQPNGNPNYAIAYKDPEFTEIFETTVKGITWKINKAGALKPVVNIEAVDTGDCSMENPTGFNARWIRNHHIAKGAQILVTRSGGVIPKILETTKLPTAEDENNMWNSIAYCPDCGTPMAWSDSGIELICTNPECPGVELAKIVFFFKAVEAEFLAEETVTKIYKAGFKTIKDIVYATFDELLEVEGLGEYAANQILGVLDKIKAGVEITKLMHASDCFSGIGAIKAKNILSQLSVENRFAIYNGQFHTWQSNEELKTKSYFKEAKTTIKSFMLGLIPFYDFVAQNRLTILPLEEETTVTGDKCAGMKVCFTGIRDSALEDVIKANGGDIVSGVSKKTTHLIVSDTQFGSSKTVKALQLGIPILTIDKFKEQYVL